MLPAVVPLLYWERERREKEKEGQKSLDKLAVRNEINFKAMELDLSKTAEQVSVPFFP